MLIPRPVRVLLLAGAAVPLALSGLGPAGAQEDGTTTTSTETTQLDTDGQDDGSTTTETTQLDTASQDDGSTTTTAQPAPAVADDATTSTTQLVLSGGVDAQPPTRVDAGAGGTAAGSDLPLAGVALAGGLVIVTGAAALKMRREQRA